MTSHDASARSLLERLVTTLRDRFAFSAEIGLDDAVDHADLGRRLRAVECAHLADSRPLGSGPAYRTY